METGGQHTLYCLENKPDDGPSGGGGVEMCACARAHTHVCVSILRAGAVRPSSAGFTKFYGFSSTHTPHELARVIHI